MKRAFAILLVAAASLDAAASWYWPFGSDKKEPPRVSELTEKASEMMDAAADYAEDGKIAEAIAEYEKAIEELDRVRGLHPDLVEQKEYASIRNKREIAVTSIDALKMSEITRNVRTITVTDTTELQRKYDEKKRKTKEAKGVKDEPKDKAKVGTTAKGASEKKEAEKSLDPWDEVLKKDPKNRKARLQKANAFFATRRFNESTKILRELYGENSKDVAVLMLLAAVEAATDHPKAAEVLLMQALDADSRCYQAYYNMAILIMQTRPYDKAEARRYYETGLKFGGPVNPAIDEATK